MSLVFLHLLSTAISHEVDRVLPFYPLPGYTIRPSSVAWSLTYQVGRWSQQPYPSLAHSRVNLHQDILEHEQHKKPYIRSYTQIVSYLYLLTQKKKHSRETHSYLLTHLYPPHPIIPYSNQTTSAQNTKHQQCIDNHPLHPWHPFMPWRKTHLTKHVGVNPSLQQKRTKNTKRPQTII